MRCDDLRGWQVLQTEQQWILSSDPIQSPEKVRVVPGGPLPRDPGGHPSSDRGGVVGPEEERRPRPHVHGGRGRQHQPVRGAGGEEGLREV